MDTNDIKYPNNNPRNGKALAGIILLAVGTMLLFRQFDLFFIPGWLFSWPMWLIFWGLFIGARSNFHKPSSVVLIILGIVFLIDQNVHNAGNIVWPLAIIALGLWLILRRHSSFDSEFWERRNKRKWDWRHQPQAGMGYGQNGPVQDTTYTEVPPRGSSARHSAGDDYLDVVSVFGGVKKMVLSKEFKGGEVVNLFGGTELDFTQADIDGRIIIDITQIFGGTKIIVPSNWQVVSDIAAVFASVDDKRIRTAAPLSNNKILVLKGVSIFAGIDIRSY